MIWPRKYGVPRSRLRRSATLQLHTPTGSKRGTPASRSSTSTVSTNSCNTNPHPNPDPNPDPNPNALTLTLSLTLTVQKVLPRPPAAAVTAHARTRARASRTRGRRPAAARPSRTFGSRRARQPGRTGGHGPTYQPLLVYVCVWRPLVFVGALALASSVLRLTAMNPNSQYGDKFIHGVLAKEPKFPAPSPRLAPHEMVFVS